MSRRRRRRDVPWSCVVDCTLPSLLVGVMVWMSLNAQRVRQGPILNKTVMTSVLRCLHLF